MGVQRVVEHHADRGGIDGHIFVPDSQALLIVFVPDLLIRDFANVDRPGDHALHGHGRADLVDRHIKAYGPRIAVLAGTVVDIGFFV